MPDFDYKNAIMHCAGDESMLKEIMSDIYSDFEAKTEKMKRFKVEGRYDMYCIEVHALKGLMATIGIKTLSDRAKKHEMASKENDIRFIEDDFEAFIKEYEEVCRKIRRALGEE